jgi:isopentenyldiphosphate isomerase
MNEVFDVVNLLDQVVGKEKRIIIHKKNLLHRAVHILIRRSSGNWVIQQRSEEKDLDPYLWTSSCSGHVDAGENYKEAAVRECIEELGVTVREHSLKEILRCSPCRETGNEFIRVYLLLSDQEIKFDRREILKIRELKLSKLSNLIKSHSGQFSHSFRHVFSLTHEILLNERGLS